jgi:uncharacterized protein
MISKDDIFYQLSNLLQLTFEVTDACNLRCKYCGYGELVVIPHRRMFNYAGNEHGNDFNHYHVHI